MKATEGRLVIVSREGSFDQEFAVVDEKDDGEHRIRAFVEAWRTLREYRAAGKTELRGADVLLLEPILGQREVGE